MYELVAGIDNHEGRALDQAELITELATAGLDARVTLLHVFEENPEGASVQQVEAIRTIRDHLEANGLEVELRESSGDPAEGILELASERDADAICVAARKRTPSGKVLFGSVTQSVLLSSDRPVFVTGMRE